MTTIEQISGWQGKRQAKSARMAELMAAAEKTGVTLDDTQSAEYDGLEREVDDIDKHLARLEKAETINRETAKPADGKTPNAAADSRGPRVVLRDNLPPGIEFARMVICRIVSFANQFSVSPLQVAKERYPENHRIHEYLQRAAVPAGSTTNQPWAGVLVDQTNLTQEFLAYLRPATIVGQFGLGGVPELRRVPFNVRIPSQISGGTGYWVGQGKAKPLTKFDFATTALGFSKVAAISVITEELARFSSPSAETLVRDGLRDALVARLDTDFVDPTKAAVANVSPASITNGVAPIASNGGTPDAVREDLEALLAQLMAGNQDISKLVLIMTPQTALGLSMMYNAVGNREFPDVTMRGGSIMGIPVIVSGYAYGGATYGNMIVGVNADSIGLADDGQVSVEASREASLEMSDAPTGDSVAGTAAALVSMWQTNSIALRAERFINWAKLRAGAVAFVQKSTVGVPGS